MTGMGGFNMALVGNILLGTASTPAVSSIASAVASAVASSVAEDTLSSKIPWNSLEYSGTVITAISGSAIGGQGGGGGDTSQCLPKSASGDFYPMTGNPSGFLTAHQDISNKLDSSAFTSYTSTALTGIQDNITALSSVVSSGPFQPTGDYAYASSLSSKLDASASGAFAPSGNYAYNSSLSGYLKTSASSTWYPMTGNPSGFLTAHQSLTGYVPKSSISAQSSIWNTVSAMVPKSSISSQSSVWNTVSAMVPQSSISAQSSNWGKVTATAGGSSQVSSINGSAILDLSTYNALTALSAIITANSAKWNKISSVSGLTSITANKYTLSAGTGISLTNDTANKVTIISVV